MNGRGFLGTNASVIADLTLLLSILVAITLTIGMILAIRKRYDIHRWVQTTGVVLNVILVLTVMVGSFFKSAAPGIPEKLGEPYYSVAALHGLLGVFAFLFGTFVMLRGNELVPNALKFNNYKLFMRIAYGAYMVVTAIGVWLYATWYINPPETATAVPEPVAQGENELTVPMVNFVYNPQEVVVPVGATVVWVNQDGAPHTATADDGVLFKSELLSKGQSFTHTFTEAGTFPYFCELHGAAGGVDMAGTIRVVPADQAPPIVAAPTVEVLPPTPQPTPPPLPERFFGQPLGTAAFRDDKARSDQIVLNLKLATPAASGQELVAFLTTPDGNTAQNVGVVTPDGSGAARLVFNEPDAANLAGRYSRFVISEEPAGSNPTKPGGTLRFEGLLPPQAFGSLTQLLAAGPGLPSEQGYVVGLRLQADELQRHAQFVADAQAAGNLDGIKRHSEHVFNLVAGSLDPQFGDLNGDGRSQNAGDGFGLLENGTQAGYIKASSDTALAAAAAPDATQAIKVHAEHVRICAANMQTWAVEAHELALQLSKTTDVAAAKTQAERLLELAGWIQRGNDANGDGEIAPVPDEGGSIVAYDHSQFMAGFGLFAAGDGAAVNIPLPVEDSGASTVSMKDFEFAPVSITIKAGTTVNWTNDGEKQHSAKAVDSSFDTELFGPGEAESVAFETPGTFAYFCELHGSEDGTQGMVGTIVVED